MSLSQLPTIVKAIADNCFVCMVDQTTITVSQQVKDHLEEYKEETESWDAFFSRAIDDEVFWLNAHVSLDALENRLQTDSQMVRLEATEYDKIADEIESRLQR